MRVVAARQTHHTNRIEQRSGTLWEGRFRCSIVDSDGYLLACCRYIDLNPVRAAMVEHPRDYTWSGYRARLGQTDPIVPLATPASFAVLGHTEEERRLRYQDFVSARNSQEELDQIRTGVKRNQLTGGSAFKADIERELGRRLSSKGQGRPKKA